MAFFSPGPGGARRNSIFSENILQQNPLIERDWGINQGQPPLHLANALDPGDDLLPEVATLVETDRRLVEAEFGGKLFAGDLEPGLRHEFEEFVEGHFGNFKTKCRPEGIGILSLLKQVSALGAETA